MSRQRLINCDFLSTEAFNDKISNKAKLLYFTMFLNGDDRGFVGNTNSIISTLENNDNEFVNNIDLSLIENNYHTALLELISMGYLYEFRDNHENKVHLIRHWFIHNRYRKGLLTNYVSFLKLVDLVEGKYVLKINKNKINQNKLNESKVNENKLNENNINEENGEYELDDNDNSYTLNDFLKDKGVEHVKDLTPEQIKEWTDICCR